MKLQIKKDSVNQTLDIFIQNSASTVGAGLTGLVFNSASLVCYYRRGATGSATALTLATQTVGGAHSDGGFVEVSSANMPGLYRLDLSDAILATGVPYVTLMLKGATNMAPVAIELQMVGFDPEANNPSLAEIADSVLDEIVTGAITLRAAAASLGTPAGATHAADAAAIKAILPTALVSGRMDASVGAMAANVMTAAAAAADLSIEIADALLDRALSTGADNGTDDTTGRTVRQALRVLRNRVAIAAGVATVYKEDDTTASFTAAVTTAAGNPISQVNPT